MNYDSSSYKEHVFCFCFFKRYLGSLWACLDCLWSWCWEWTWTAWIASGLLIECSNLNILHIEHNFTKCFNRFFSWLSCVILRNFETFMAFYSSKQTYKVFKILKFDRVQRTCTVYFCSGFSIQNFLQLWGSRKKLRVFKHKSCSRFSTFRLFIDRTHLGHWPTYSHLFRFSWSFHKQISHFVKPF